MIADANHSQPELILILFHRDIIKVDQDPLGIQGLHLKSIDNIHVSNLIKFR